MSSALKTNEKFQMFWFIMSGFSILFFCVSLFLIKQIGLAVGGLSVVVSALLLWNTMLQGSIIRYEELLESHGIEYHINHNLETENKDKPTGEKKNE